MKQFFHVPQLYEQTLLCFEDKLKESMLLGKMTLLHYRMFAGEDNKDIYRAAAAMEMMMLSWISSMIYRTRITAS